MINSFDIIIILVASISTFFGLYRGAVHITISIISFIASIFFAMFLFEYAQIILAGYVQQGLISNIASGTLSFVISLIIFTFISGFVVKALFFVCKTTIDRIFGFLMGFVIGILIALPIFVTSLVLGSSSYKTANDFDDLIFEPKIEQYPNWLSESKTSPYLEEITKKIVLLLPKDSGLRAMKLPKKQSQDLEKMDVIDKIKEKEEEKGKTRIEKLDKELEDDIKAFFDKE